jgi:pimeloyl-ACP methyl ester carboxylesterase
LSLVGTLRAAAFVARLARPDPSAPAPRRLGLGGGACDLYEPRRSARATVVAIHGVTVNGKDDPRLRAFARALAASGSRCVVPTLPGLAGRRRDPADVDAIGSAIEAATSERSAVVVGFSHGASLALLAAARPRWAGRVRSVLCFGAYHSLARVAAALRDLPEPGSARDRDDFVYAHLVEARRRAEELGLAPALRAAADQLLRRYCAEATDAEKMRFFDEHLRPLRLAGRPDPIGDVALDLVSPAGQVGGLACPVDLVHDPDDSLVPVSEGRALLAELRRAGPGHAHRLLVTRLVRHVSAAAVARPEALRLLRMLAPLVGG